MEPSAGGQQDVMKVTAMLLNKDHSVRDVNVENQLAIDFEGARK
jgi:hypothetical protein